MHIYRERKRDSHVSSIDRDLYLFDEEEKKRRTEKDSNKQSTITSYIYIISSNNPADSGNEANIKVIHRPIF